MTLQISQVELFLPTTVADYLYNNTDSFNKGEAGTDSDGIVAKHCNWGLKSQLINGAGGIAEALMAGKHVLAAVGNSQFILKILIS